MQENHALLKFKSRKEIEKEFTSAKREKEVIDTTVSRAKVLGIENLKAIKEFVSEIVKLTKKAEVEYILHAQSAKRNNLN